MMTTSINQYVRRMDTEVDTIIDIDIQKVNDENDLIIIQQTSLFVDSIVYCSNLFGDNGS